MRLRPWVELVCVLLAGCASTAPRDGEITVVRHVDRAVSGSASVPLAGERCAGSAGACRCRQSGDAAETQPPADGKKRFEIRIAADGGRATLESSTLGRFESVGPVESCFYVDVPAGSQHEVGFVARADVANQGIAPRARVAEYGPAGPWWYDVMAIECAGPSARCDRAGVDTWARRTVDQRRRGRLEACGSAVVSALKWETSGGQHDRDGGLFRDLTVRFAFEVKKFATQFAPGSTECVPK